MSREPRIIWRPMANGSWTDPQTEVRQSGHAFRSKETRDVDVWKTERDLLTEARALDADEVVIEVDLPPGSFYADRTGVKANAADAPFPGVVVRLIGTRFGDLRYSCDAFGTDWAGRGWKANLRAVALGLESLRRVERYGIARRGEQYVGWAALPPGTPMTAGERPKMTLERAAAVLAGASDGLVTAPNVLNDPEDARLAFRMAAKRWHPDAIGGNPETWAQVDEAWQLVEKHHANLP